MSSPFTRRQICDVFWLTALWLAGQLAVVLLFGRPWGLDRGSDTETYQRWAARFPDLGGEEWGYSGFVVLVKLSTWLGLGLNLIVVVNLVSTVAAARALLEMGRDLSGSTAGWVAASTYLVHPLVSQWFKYALTDAMFSAGVVLVVYSYWKLRQRPTRLAWIAFVAAVLLTSSLRPTGLVLAGAAFSLALAAIPQRRGVKFAVYGLVWLAVGAIAATSPIFSGERNSSYSLVARAATGEIVYGDSTRALNMPPVDIKSGSTAEFARYVIDHPMPNLRLAATKIGWELAQVRPWYSASLNLYIALFMLGFYGFVALGLASVKNVLLRTILIGVTLPLLLMIGFTWAIHEGRFAWWFLPLWTLPLGVGVQRFCSSKLWIRSLSRVRIG